MNEKAIRDLSHRYYRAWARRERAEVRSLLADALDFRSFQDRFGSADAFLDACWQYSAELTGVDFLKEIYSGDQAFVVLDWATESGGRFADAEYLRAAAGKIHQIVVLNNKPEFRDLIT